MTPGFSPAAVARLGGCLDRLMPHLRMDCIAVTGGVGMQIGLAALGHPGVRHEVADLDLVAASPEAVSANVVDWFLVSHYHAVQPGVPKFMIQLVDPDSRIRIDVFPDLAGSIAEARTLHVGIHPMRVLPLSRIFEHKVETLRRASAVKPIDPKHVQDARSLGEVLARRVPEVATAALRPNVYGTEADWSCSRCALSSHPAWRLAPKARIFELLGW